MYTPSTTYRIQFHKDFTFKSLIKIIPYLHKLGIDTIYASPIFEAIPGSTHGYDCVNPLKINSEIGTEEELFEISKTLKNLGISWLQDIVPNHMAFHPDNKWLMDVLEKGEKSDFATFFDINFSIDKRLMVPFLGENLDVAINNGTVKIVKVEERYFLNSSGSNWPINLDASSVILEKGMDTINENPLELQAIANLQFYQLCNWQETNFKINYRRFFTVNNLICLNIQNENNFNIYHKYIFELIEKGVFQGLRIDHIDGLYDPKQYLDRLRMAVGDEIYIVVEKILEKDELLPSDWNAQGTTGYDFLAMMNNLFTNVDAEKPFNNLYRDVLGKKLDTKTLIIEKKKIILHEHMQGELDNLFSLLISLNLVDESDLILIGEDKLKLSIGEMLIQMPVYRFYNYNFPLNIEQAKQVEQLFEPLESDQGVSEASGLLKSILLQKSATKSDQYRENVKQFFQRCMQFTGPLMAKGVEDTVMFTYNRFIGHSEVGDEPDAFGLSTNQFHEKMLHRQSHSPLSINASSTHDTKKGEDVRARLNVLTDLPLAWTQLISDLQASTAALQTKYPEFKWVHKNDIYLIYQTILGALPMPEQDEDDFTNRIALYIEKALREAKKRSGWAEPDEDYEQKVKEFSNMLLNQNLRGAKSITDFLAQIADFGIINSLSQLLLKFTCPGIPDIYQGTEVWDLSLVDPDNRRPVDYQKLESFEDTLNETSTLKTLWNDRYAGKIKLWLTQLLIKTRKESHKVFEGGEYIQLTVKGKYRQNIFAFARVLNKEWFVVAIPLGTADLCKQLSVEVNKINWDDTQIILPDGAPSAWNDVLNHKGGTKDIINNGILINQIFDEIPLGLIKITAKNSNRAAGILMHITSLPSAFGIGDLGKEAFKFIDFLANAKQKHWQILPLNPTKKENGHSPYSSNSAVAGNILLISPESLVADGLLDFNDVKHYELANKLHIDFEATEKNKFQLLKKAFKKFSEIENLHDEYQFFVSEESDWLDDFSVYSAIKIDQGELEWYNWPEKLKIKEEDVIKEFIESHQAEINEIKFQQFIFTRQWCQLKEYANVKNVKIIGDLPFYLDRDSAEIWSQPELFLLDKDLKPEMVAGVPPDYFNDKGQLWGMPIFNWKKMKDDHYSWWLKRLENNIKLYDLVRLDHFRAFSAYWEIPAKDEDAVNGNWKPGPSVDFFEIMQNKFNSLPFIAEDLGEITEDVEILRDRFKLPGMKVLQFAFGEDLISSPHIPHNFDSVNSLVYTGTHDNNTLKGWFKNELDDAGKKRLGVYFGVDVTEINVNELLNRLSYSSIAKIAILPIQDVLGLDQESRMNLPGTISGNWLWRLGLEDCNVAVSSHLAQETEMYGRSN
ncbi:malto-oligosyltrehalose synthase [Pedobacter mucosus]|uniref:malto-oligosyltrehalose synthase n=1 Tax=Pedobacter mucosus TaxID=2895286 RepID=UPI001EE4E8A6|nr:malto-oligosyltrehalose synthase [Pedobacter mucosus]UKT65685.1 malto-oligosyltrehalose synthase [Pedobacter mucosus]